MWVCDAGTVGVLCGYPVFVMRVLWESWVYDVGIVAMWCGYCVLQAHEFELSYSQDVDETDSISSRRKRRKASRADTDLQV